MPGAGSFVSLDSVVACAASVSDGVAAEVSEEEEEEEAVEEDEVEAGGKLPGSQPFLRRWTCISGRGRRVGNRHTQPGIQRDRKRKRRGRGEREGEREGSNSAPSTRTTNEAPKLKRLRGRAKADEETGRRNTQQDIVRREKGKPEEAWSLRQAVPDTENRQLQRERRGNQKAVAKESFRKVGKLI